MIKKILKDNPTLLPVAIGGLLVGLVIMWISKGLTSDPPVPTDRLNAVNDNVPFPDEIYDHEAAKENLRKIGRALQLYRQDAGYLPQAERKNKRDAGLPFSSVMEVLEEEKKPWSLPVGTFVANIDEYGEREHKFRYQDLTLPYLYQGNTKIPEERNAKLENLWSKMGDEIPILIDSHSWHLMSKATTKSRKILFMKLNGEVGEYEVDNSVRDKIEYFISRQ